MSGAVESPYSPEAVDALRAAIARITAESLETLRCPQVRGPYPHPTADDLAKSGYLHALARWGEAAARRSRRTLGLKRMTQTLEAARRLACAADLLAELDGAPDDGSGAQP